MLRADMVGPMGAPEITKKVWTQLVKLHFHDPVRKSSPSSLRARITNKGYAGMCDHRDFILCKNKRNKRMT